MVVTRYIVYLIGTALFTWALTQIEIASPGSLKLQVYADANDLLGTSEYSPVELLQPGILIICGLLYAWVAQRSPPQRPIALVFGALAAMFIIRELDYFLDNYIVDNFWQVPAAIIAALAIAYTWRQKRRFRIAWLRIWPSPGLTLLFAGAIVHFSFAPFVGHEPLWQAVLGDEYRRVIKLTVEEFIELAGYYLWLIGTVEYWFQARALAVPAPESAAMRRRRRPRHGGGRY